MSAVRNWRPSESAVGNSHPSPDEKNSLFRGLHVDGGPIGQNLGDALHDLGGIVAGADDCVAAGVRSLLLLQVYSLRARLLAKVGQQRDVAAD